jgi:hypothetical protein
MPKRVAPTARLCTAECKNQGQAKKKQRVAKVTNISLIKVPKHSPDFIGMANWGIPALLLDIILRIVLNPCLGFCGGIDAAELFAGCCSVTNGLKAVGLVSIPFEIKMMGELMDMNSCPGFCLAITLVLRMAMKGRGLLWLAPVCSTWIFMSSGTTQRTKWAPEGNTRLECVRNANLMSARCVVLCALADALNVTFILEQPLSSVMNYTARFQWLIKKTTVYMASPVHMGAYKGDSQKSLKLFSNRPWVTELIKAIPKGTVFSNGSIVTVSYNADGQRNVTGGSGLKATQAYPKSFGTAVGKAYARNMDTPIVASQQPFLHTTKTLVAQMKAIQTDTWADAELQEVLTYLSV